MRRVSYQHLVRGNPLSVWYAGTDALKKGQGLCWNRDIGTAAAFDGRRDNHVERPSLTNNMHFAGVVTRDYSANAQGQPIVIDVPPCVTEIAPIFDTVIDSTRLSCIAHASGGGHAGMWGLAGFEGRGTALALETVDAQIAGENDMTGVVDATGLTITAGSAIFGDVLAGDLVVVYAGTETANNAVVPGIYTIASLTTTVLTLSSSCVSGDTDAVACSYSVIRAYPTTLAYLFDGKESGLVQDVSVRTGAENPLMVGGFKYVHGGAIITADGTEDVAVRVPLGLQDGFKVISALTGNDLVLTLAAAGIMRSVVDVVDGTTGLSDGNPVTFNTITLNAANEQLILEWMRQFRVLYVSGATLSTV